MKARTLWLQPFNSINSLTSVRFVCIIRTFISRCWISNGDGAAWSFVGPVIVIIAVSNVFMLALCTINVQWKLSYLNSLAPMYHSPYLRNVRN